MSDCLIKLLLMLRQWFILVLEISGLGVPRGSLSVLSSLDNLQLNYEKSHLCVNESALQLSHRKTSSPLIGLWISCIKLSTFYSEFLCFYLTNN